MPFRRAWRAWLETFLLIGVLCFSLWIRTYHLDWPVADWHSFRQADTASVTREYVKHGIDIFRPQYHDLSNIQSGKDNLSGWRMVEFPLINGVIAWILRENPTLDLVVTSRWFSIMASLFSLAVLWYLAREWFGKAVALLTALVYGFMPYAVYYSRAILPEPFLVFFFLMTALCVWLWAKHSPQQWRVHPFDFLLVLASVFWSLALLQKPVALFFAPVFLGIAWKQKRLSWPDLTKTLVLFSVGFLPLLWWRRWIQQFPSGIPAADWLLNGNGIRWRPAWFRWLFADRFGRLMFGFWGAPVLLLGLVAGWVGARLPFSFPRTRREMKTWISALDAWLQSEGVIIGSWIGILTYFSVIATGNVQHDYYQVILVPFIALTWARGAVWLIRQGKTLWQQVALLKAVALVLVFSFLFAWYEVEGFYHINNPAIVSGGAAVARLTPPDALVIAPQFGDTSFLFHTDRRGWPIGFEIDDKRAKGAQFYITTSQDDEANELMRRFPVLEQTSEYILIDLRTEK